VRRLLAVLALAALGRAAPDPYEAYVRSAPEFRTVEHVEAPGWDTWIYMPWYYKWTIGHDDAAGEFCREYGINGGFTDHGHGPTDWLEKWDLRFYNDHTAGKGGLYLRGANDKKNFARYQGDPFAVREVPIDAAFLEKSRDRIHKRIALLRHKTGLVAYALDDEASWGAFVIPLPWRLNDDDAAYARWLATVYGHEVKPQYVTPDFTREQLGRPLKELDFAPFLDRMTYNDSVWADLIGTLVESANGEDVRTPAGLVGCQNPSLWGGYDYAKLAPKLQFVEAYEMGSAPEILRSFTRNAIPIVSTHFHHDGRDHEDSWEAWYYFAHGQRGMIGWVSGWFDGKTPRPWLAKFAPVLKELGGVQGPKLVGAQWQHDGIAIYYSHPSVQVSWVLDSEPHGKNWAKRGKDDALGTSHNVRRAWEYLLADAGLQYDHLAYDRVIRDGVPEEYRVLILPAAFALSDVEAERIRAFAARGGLVVADFMCGLFDQHGKGRTAGALDDLFGVKHDGGEKRGDFFGGKLWVETDQDAGYETPTWAQLLGTGTGKLRDGYAVAERKLAGPYVSDRARYLNLSPQRYLVAREAGRAGAEQRAPFLEHLGVTPAVTATGDHNLEVTRWRKGDRIYVFVVQNPSVDTKGDPVVEQGRAKVELRFRDPVAGLKDERTGKALGDGDRFALDFDRCEALLLSYPVP